ncbi:unnamed protein product [Ilex paraguariensis]|uniref:Pentatricopeptide repeat-containing protein n=1 Tax=Ilex paraguariensis TaxID=185542 RepID=A0ABC8REG9_9AQUA
MALFSTAIKRTLLSTLPTKHHSLSTAWSSAPPSDQTLVSAAVSILKHHRSKSRWNHLRTLTPTAGFSPSQVSQITLQLRNNPRLALRFFQFTLQHSLCSHSLSSYATIIHILSRSRLKSHAQTLIQSAIRKFQDTHLFDSSDPPPIFETLIRTYRACDSAPFVFELLIKACLESKRIDQSIQIVRMLRSKGIHPRISTCNSLIESIIKIQGCYAGYDMFREVFGLDGESGNDNGSRVKGVVPNVYTFSIIMVGFYRDGLVEDVEKVWSEMANMNYEPNAYCHSVLMEAYCDDGRIEDAMSVWEEMGFKGVKHDVVSYNTIIGGFCRIGEMGRAEEFFREMELSGGVDGTCVTFEHLINGYCKIGDVDSAILLYKDMCRKGFRPESSTIDAVIRGLCDKNSVSEALDFLRVAVKKHDIVPKGKSYEGLIKGLCLEGRMEEALKLQREMIGKGYEPNSEIYFAFIDGYTKKGNKELAKKLRKEMLETRTPQEES